MGGCCCKSPDIDALNEDPSVIDSIRATSFGRATLSSDGTWVISRYINTAGGDVVYYTNDSLGLLQSCLGDAQYPLSDIDKVELIQGDGIKLGKKRIPLHGSDGRGVKITFKQSGGHYTIIAFGSPNAGEFVSKLSRQMELTQPPPM